MKDFLKGVVFVGLFAVPFLTLYVENDYFFPFITGKNFWFRIIVDITVAAWALLALYEVKYRPRFSWILVSFSALIIAMFFANLLGVHPESSFWSNFERMDGYVSLVHTFLYMLVAGSVLVSREHVTYLLNTSLVVAFMVALYGLAQYAGIAEGNGRIDSRLGNAAYMAIYMLFHIFIAFWLFIGTKRPNLKIIYGLIALLFAFVLIETGTRGTALGLAVGVLVMSGYIGLFGTKFKEFRKYAIGGFALLVLAVAGFVAGRDSQLIQSNPNLARIANISIDDLKVRGTIWGMAWEGVKERPVLGWGQSNFNYVFNEHYKPSLYAQEQWFDRAHNIFMDWLIAGGFVGLALYLSVFAACVYYLLIRPLLHKNDESFTVLERGILLGLLAGYFTHNFVVFDNIVSYIFFAIILGIIHSRVSTPIKAVETTKVDEAIITQFAVPVVGVFMIAVIYFAHAPGMAAASQIILGFREPDPLKRLEYFKDALAQDSFAHQEITEQISQQAMNLMRDKDATVEVREVYGLLAEKELLRLLEEKPGDARAHVFVGSFYRAINEQEKAAQQMALARSFSPNKQAIIIQQGFIELALGRNEAARDFFKTAFELDTRYLEAREYYAAALFYTNQSAEAMALMDSPQATERFAQSDFLLAAANQAMQTDFLITLFKARLEKSNEDPQDWATLSFLYYEKGDVSSAVATLKDAQTAIPSFAPTATCIADNIKLGSKDPADGC